MAISLGSGILYLDVDDKNLNAGMRRVISNGKTALKDLQTAAGLAFSTIGPALAAGLGAAINNFAQAGDAIQEMSQRTGIGTEALSKLKYAAELGGTSLEGMETGIRRMQGSITDLAQSVQNGEDATSGIQEKFAQLGLTWADLKDKAPEQQFMTIAERLAGIEDATLKAGIATDIFGRSGTAILPMLADGAQRFREYFTEAEKFATVYSEQDAANAAALADAMHQAKLAFAGIVAAFGKVLAPDAKDLAEAIRDLGLGIKSFVAEHPLFMRALGIFAAGIAFTNTVLGPAVLIFQALSGVMQAIAAVKAALAVQSLTGAAAASLSVLGGATGTVLAYAAGFGVLVYAIYSVIDAYRDKVAAEQSAADAEAQAENSMWRAIDALEAKGAVFDREAIAQMTATEQMAVVADGQAQVMMKAYEDTGVVFSDMVMSQMDGHEKFKYVQEQIAKSAQDNAKPVMQVWLDQQEAAEDAAKTMDYSYEVTTQAARDFGGVSVDAGNKSINIYDQMANRHTDMANKMVDNYNRVYEAMARNLQAQGQARGGQMRQSVMRNTALFSAPSGGGSSKVNNTVNINKGAIVVQGAGDAGTTAEAVITKMSDMLQQRLGRRGMRPSLSLG